MPIPPCEFPHCLVDGECRLTGRARESDHLLCGTSVPWRLQWIKERRINARDLNTTVLLPKRSGPVPCAGCGKRKETISKHLPTLGPIVSNWLDRIGRRFFNITSWHPVKGNWSIVVTTSPLTQRKTNKYLGQRGTLPLCLRSLEEAGFTKDQIIVYGEPRSIVPTEYNHVIRKERMGLLANLRDGLANNIEQHNPDLLLIVEDDIIYQPELLYWLQQNPWPGTASLISLFKMQGFEGRNEKGRKEWMPAEMLLEEATIPNWRKVRKHGRPWGSGALVMLRPIAEHYLKYPGPGRGTPDLVLADWIHRVGGEYWQASPSRVQHLAPERSVDWPRSTWQSGANRNFTATEVSFEMPAYVKQKSEYENNPRNIPVYLISFNRHEWLKNMAKECERFSDNIIIVDNQSSWPPLLEWLQHCDYKVIYSPQNYGKKVVWEMNLPIDNFYVVSDPDLDISTVPAEVLTYLREGLLRYPDYASAGLSLSMEGVHRFFADRVKAGESKFWKETVDGKFYRAAIDTTFAMYRLGDKPSYGNRPALRAVPPYTAKHIPWYMDPANMTEEDKHYYTVGSTWGRGSYAHHVKRRVKCLR